MHTYTVKLFYQNYYQNQAEPKQCPAPHLQPQVSIPKTLPLQLFKLLLLFFTCISINNIWFLALLWFSALGSIKWLPSMEDKDLALLYSLPHHYHLSSVSLTHTHIQHFSSPQTRYTYVKFLINSIFNIDIITIQI